MDLDNFLRHCHEKVNLHSDFLLNQLDPSTISYIQPFCSNDAENPLVGYIYVSVFILYLYNFKLINYKAYYIFRKNLQQKLLILLLKVHLTLMKKMMNWVCFKFYIILYIYT